MNETPNHVSMLGQRNGKINGKQVSVHLHPVYDMVAENHLPRIMMEMHEVDMEKPPSRTPMTSGEVVRGIRTLMEQRIIDSSRSADLFTVLVIRDEVYVFVDLNGMQARGLATTSYVN